MTVILRTKNFQGHELKCKCGCGLLNYDNLFLMKLEVFRDLPGSRLEVTSGCRCIKHNKTVGGKPSSLHIAEGKTAMAADVAPLDVNPQKIFIFAVKAGFFNEVIWYRKMNFIHLGIDRNQKEVYYDII